MRSMGDLHQYGKRTFAEAHMADTGPAQQAQTSKDEAVSLSFHALLRPGRWAVAAAESR
jgi:hypothetical protein